MLKLPLHPYQEPAVDLFLERGSLLVAYEMGLGKTPIAIACCEELLGCRDIHRALLVVPASLRIQWAIALAKFTDLPVQPRNFKGTTIQLPRSDSAAIIDGTASKRRQQITDAIKTGAEYVICSYETVQSDTRLIKRLKPGMVVLDEASAIKNFGAERTKKIKTSLMTEYRLALTGTPVENKPEEAFSIMEWVDAEVLGPEDLFEHAYIDRWPNGTVKKYKNVHLLNRKLNQGMVRRSRKDPEVAKYLPTVDHDQWYVDLDPGTRKSYILLANDLLDSLLAVRGNSSFDMAAYYSGQKYDENTGLGRIMARQQCIEMMLDHPLLVAKSAESWLQSEQARARGEKKAAWPGSKYCYEAVFEGKLDTATGFAKLEFLIAQLDKILAFEENKVLVFSRYPEMLRIIQSRLATGSVTYHGGMTAKQKATAVAEFTAKDDTRVFLSSHAGAYGTDMHMANYLINYDLPWSGGTWDQINGRHQRVSSEFSTVVIRDIVMNDTVEVRKLAMLKHKLKVAQAVVDGKAPSGGRIENDLISLTDFLQSEGQ